MMGLAAGPGMLAARSATPVGAIERVSVADGAAAAERNARPEGGSSLACSSLSSRRCTKRTMSDDGTKVVYSSAAGNLVDGDTNGRVDVFLTTLNPGKPPTPPTAGSGGSPADPGIAPSVISTVRISVGPGGAEGNGDSVGASISPDGKWIAFESSASNLAGGDANGPTVDVFVYQVDTGALHLASAGGDGHSFSASVANNGTVSFTSLAGNLVPGASGQQVYARVDPAGAGRTELVSAAEAGGPGDGQSGESTISGDGTKVAFTSASANLGTGQSPGDDIFIRTIGGGTMMLTSGANAYLPSISADGSRVIFIAEGFDNDGIADIYQSPTQGGSQPTIFANCPCRSGGDVAPVWATLGSGGAVIYSSSAPFSRSNRYLDAQVFEHNPGQAIVSVVDDEVANAPAEFPSVSADGALVAFESAADNLTDGDVNSAVDVFVSQMGDRGDGFMAQRMIRVSVYATGDARRAADSFASMPGSPAGISSDGNLVAFASDSSNLVPGDGNGASDIFVRNRGTGRTERVSVSTSGGEADGGSISPAMSTDGRFVVFASMAGNLVPGDTNGVMDIFVRDRLRKETRRLSEKPGAGQSPLPSQHPSISANGNWVAWDSAGDFAAIPPTTSGRPNVFRFNMETGAIDMVSTMIPDSNNAGRRAGFKSSWSPSVADDGSVAFVSEQTGMTPSNADDPIGGNPNWIDIFVARADLSVVKVSMNSDPQPVKAEGGDSYEPQISADGTKVVFVTGGKSNLPKTGGDQNPDTDIYLRDLAANTTMQINVPGSGAPSGDNRRPTINGDGSVVAFISDAPNLVSGDNNGVADVFVAKVAGASVSLSRVTPASGEPNGPSAMPTISGDGHSLVFASRASNLVDGDGNGAYDWFARADAAIPCITCTADGIGPNDGKSIGDGSLVVGSGPGYRFVAADGGIFSFGPPFAGSAAKTRLAKPIVGMAATPSNNGYWLVASDGGIFSYGDAVFYGSTGAIRLSKPIVGMTATPSGKGYWFVASDGGIFAFGDAKFFGSMGGKPLNKPIVGMASTASGNGYWLVASDGGIFSFGDAKFFGSTGNIKLNKPIVGMDRTASGNGYRFVASDGGIFSFGDATFLGSMGGKRLAKPIVGMARTRAGDGYWLVASDGGIFSYGSAGFRGSTGNLRLASPIVGMAS